MPDYLAGIDIGGTHIKFAAASRDGDILTTLEDETEDIPGVPAPWPATVKRLLDESEREHGEAAGVGLAAPGLAAPDGRSIAFMPGRLEGLEGLDWTQALDVSSTVHVLNDAHAALLGEVWRGAAAGSQHAILLTLGTGVGGAILYDGRLTRGAIGRAGHLGHFSLDRYGPPDITGTPGSLEDAIGECTLAARTGGRFGSTQEMVEAYREGDVFAAEVWLRSVRGLAASVASLINILDPEVVVIGGGIARAGGDLFDPLARFLDDMEWRPGGRRVRIVPAALGPYAGALGAAYYALQHQ